MADVVLDGFLRGSNKELVCVLNSLATQPTAMRDGFLRDATGALVLKG